MRWGSTEAGWAGSIVAISLGATVAAGGCGRTGLTFAADETGETTSAEETTDSGESTETGFDTGESTDDGSFIPDDTGETDTGVEPKTCREMLECVLGCVVGLDPQCFAECGQGADPAELQAAIGLIGCLVPLCIDNGQCVIPDLASEECIGCIGLGLFLPEPPGCEDAAMACM